MERYRFQFGDGDGLAAEAIESDHSSFDDAMCDAARTVAEMLKEQAQSAGDMTSFSLSVQTLDGTTVGEIAIVVSRPGEGR